ncbi:Threonine/homoserine/homoserine lactone efflux protein [Microbulbifer donghaiensis]|uniref:Threonine/homoserine/homoserine lactone efflux protein n=1 Tax=Microbulbifer donghaiensis TaxID=494016 RepID=A0A1M4ZRK6_9GAMM|nr:LysE family translocator [Microbulbifer donghaiensis]SHF20638.1 Threonine/homoserine/homoserine lactone efflux protein [Microbulbifer donghaiensis]
MTLTTSLALFISMVVLALIPGPGVLTVTARSATAGLRHGLSTAAGIVAGDFAFISLALLGLATLSSALGELFVVLKYLGAAYLIWLGISLITSSSISGHARDIQDPKHSASFFAGLVTTLSNPKAILFYLSFFPALLDLSSIAVLDAALLYLIATVSVGSVMFGYAYLAHKANSVYSSSKSSRTLKAGSGALLVGSGLYVAARG